MLADLEWKTPHWAPNGMTVAEWVEQVRHFEKRGWLRDPATMTWSDGPFNYATQYQRAGEAACLPLCWRRRCHRAGRCRNYMPLAIREFMPEFGHYIARLNGEVLLDEDHSLDPAKLFILDEFLGPWLEASPATENARHWAGHYHAAKP